MELREQQIEILETAKDYIPKLVNGLKEIVVFIQSGKEQMFSMYTSDAIEGIEWTLNTMELTKDIHNEDIDMASINEVLSEMLEAINNKDYVLVSDIIEYELIPKITMWEQSIINLVNR